MSELSDKLAYARGLFDGMKMQPDAPEYKLMQALLDALQAASDELKELRDAHDDLSEYVDVLDDDINELESEVYGDFDEDDECDDEDEDDECDDEDEDDEDCDECDDCDDCDDEDCEDCCSHASRKELLDSLMVERKCPNCGSAIDIPMSTLLKRGAKIVCPSCGSEFKALNVKK